MDKSYNLLGKEGKVHRHGASLFIEHKKDSQAKIYANLGTDLVDNTNRAAAYTSEMKYRDISNTFKLLH